MEGAQLRRLPYAAVRAAEAIAVDPQLGARGFPVAMPTTRGGTVAFAGPPFLLSATPLRLRRPPPRLGEHDGELRRDAAWAARAAPPIPPPRVPWTPARRRRVARGEGARVLDGTLVLDFTWVVAGPVATRILADQGARVVKVERRDAMDFGNRRGGLTGNLNRGKQSIVLNMADPRGVDARARPRAARGRGDRQLLGTRDAQLGPRLRWSARAQAGRDRGRDVGLWLDGAAAAIS